MAGRLYQVTFIVVLFAAVVSSGCRSTFDASGNLRADNFRFRRGDYNEADRQLANDVDRRSIQIWMTDGEAPFARGSTIHVGQAALIGPDGLALTALHVVDSGVAFTIHDPEDSGSVIRVIRLTPDGPEVAGPGDTIRVIRNPLIMPVRLEKAFPESDLCLVRVSLESSMHFELSADLPAIGDELTVGLNPVIHPGIKAVTGRVRGVDDMAGFHAIHGSAAAIQGDSGSPAVLSDGTLVGCVVSGRMALLNPGHISELTVHGFNSLPRW